MPRSSSARRAGAASRCQVTDAEGGFFRLSYGGRSIHCRESLSELTTAVAMSICDDKATTTPRGAGRGRAGSRPDLGRRRSPCRRDVSQPARQGRREARARRAGPRHRRRPVDHGGDHRRRRRSRAGSPTWCSSRSSFRARTCVSSSSTTSWCAAALRRPASVVGDGERTIRELIEKQSRRRSAGTGGEFEHSARRGDGAHHPPRRVSVRQRPARGRGAAGAAHRQPAHRRHHPRRHRRGAPGPGRGRNKGRPAPSTFPSSASTSWSSRRACRTIAFIEANERPGLANHEPQPTAERFIDLLFPLSIPAAMRQVLVEAAEQKGS